MSEEITFYSAHLFGVERAEHKEKSSKSVQRIKVVKRFLCKRCLLQVSK